MLNKTGNFYGILVLILLFVTVMGLFTSKSLTTGFAVKSTACFEGTAFGECSSVKPKYCDNGALKPDCNKCGCNENEFCQADGTCLQKCSDGTLYGQCSANKPLLCFKGSLLENCFECGCFPGQTCLNNGACSGSMKTGAGSAGTGSEERKVAEPNLIEDSLIEERKTVEEKIISYKCPDGTNYGACSAKKPEYCYNGNLINDCSKCGCDQGGLCSNGECLTGSAKIGFLWEVFCGVFYYNEYNDCVADVIRYQNR